jgi:hypothetical protein
MIFVWGNVSLAGLDVNNPLRLSAGWANVAALAAVVATDPLARFIVPASGTLRNFQVRHNSLDPNPAVPILYGVRLNGVPTPLSVTVNSNGTSGLDSVNTVPVLAGQLVEIIVQAGGPIAGRPLVLNVDASVQLNI